MKLGSEQTKAITLLFYFIKHSLCLFQFRVSMGLRHAGSAVFWSVVIGWCRNNRFWSSNNRFLECCTSCESKQSMQEATTFVNQRKHARGHCLNKACMKSHYPIEACMQEAIAWSKFSCRRLLLGESKQTCRRPLLSELKLVVSKGNIAQSKLAGKKELSRS